MFLFKKRTIRVAISAFCNFNCVYCNGHNSRKPGKPGAMEDFRRKSLKHGVISTKETIEIINTLRLAGFDGVTLTGGEPLLNPEWDKIVNASKEMGMSRICVTTNGMLLNTYLKKNKYFPRGLTLLAISLDTINSDRFKTITGYDKLKEIIKSVKTIRKNNPKLIIRANKVVMQSDMKFLLKYLKFCEKIGFNEVKLLSLILKDNKDKKFFEKEFVFVSDILDFFSKHTKYKFSIDEKHEHISKLPSGLKIILVDTNPTLRNDSCVNCPIYCQEGFFTVRVATDGNITTCPDYKSKLPLIDGSIELKKGTLSNRVNELVQVLKTVKLEKTLNKFFRKKGLFKNKINDKK